MVTPTVFLVSRLFFSLLGVVHYNVKNTLIWISFWFILCGFLFVIGRARHFSLQKCFFVTLADDTSLEWFGSSKC